MVHARVKWTTVAACAVALLLSGCGSSESTSRAAAAASVEPSGSPAAQAVGASQKTFISLDNQLALADGTPLTVTWKVSDTVNEVWDGNGRPDHEPPDGLQGLVQDATSGPYTARAEINTKSSYNPFFTLTPTITVDGVETALTPWDMLYDSQGWHLTTDRPRTNTTKVYGCRTGQSTTPPLTTATPKGDLTYTVTATCDSDTFTFTVQPK